MEHSRRWQLHIGGSKMFEPLFQAGLSFPSHFFLQNIRIWYIKIEFQGSFFGMECRIGSWEAIFAADHALAPHIEDDTRNEEQHCKQPNFPPNHWDSQCIAVSNLMMMNFQCHLGRCVHYMCAGNHFSVALGQNCLHQDKGSCISFDNDLIGFVSTFPAHLSQHIINAQVPVWESISWNTAFATVCAHHD